jgi:hydrogenase maturation protease
MKKTLVLGVGNLLLSDDGVGVHTIWRLQQTKQLPEEVQVIDGGTCGLDLLQYLEGVECLIVVDAVKAGKLPGTVLRMVDDQIPAYFALKVSPHEIGVAELMAAAKLRDIYPVHVVVLGVQPECLETGVELSPVVAARVDELVDQIVKEVSEPV